MVRVLSATALRQNWVNNACSCRGRLVFIVSALTAMYEGFFLRVDAFDIRAYLSIVACKIALGSLGKQV